jgi:hypothetical protein
MSQSNEALLCFSDLSGGLSARCPQATEHDRLEDLPNDNFGQVFASVLRVFAAKAQNGQEVRPFGHNSGVTATDVAIGCTAVLEAAGLAVFELGAWQSMSGMGRSATGQ